MAAPFASGRTVRASLRWSIARGRSVSPSSGSRTACISGEPQDCHWFTRVAARTTRMTSLTRDEDAASRGESHRIARKGPSASYALTSISRPPGGPHHRQSRQRQKRNGHIRRSTGIAVLVVLPQAMGREARKVGASPAPRVILGFAASPRTTNRHRRGL